MTCQLVATCVSASAVDIEAFDDSSKEIAFSTFKKAIGREAYADLLESFGYARTAKRGLTLWNDWSVSYQKGTFLGKKTWVMMHSQIHYFYQELE